MKEELLMTATTVSRIQGVAIFKLIATKTSTFSTARDTTIEEDEALGSRGPSTRGAWQILRNDGNTLSGVWVKGFVHIKEVVYDLCVLFISKQSEKVSLEDS